MHFSLFLPYSNPARSTTRPKIAFVFGRYSKRSPDVAFSNYAPSMTTYATFMFELIESSIEVFQIPCLSGPVLAYFWVKHIREVFVLVLIEIFFFRQFRFQICKFCVCKKKIIVLKFWRSVMWLPKFASSVRRIRLWVKKKRFYNFIKCPLKILIFISRITCPFTASPQNFSYPYISNEGAAEFIAKFSTPTSWFLATKNWTLPAPDKPYIFFFFNIVFPRIIAEMVPKLYADALKIVIRRWHVVRLGFEFYDVCNSFVLY